MTESARGFVLLISLSLFPQFTFKTYPSPIHLCASYPLTVICWKSSALIPGGTEAVECKWLITSVIDRCHPIVFEGGATHLILTKSTIYAPRPSILKQAPGMRKAASMGAAVGGEADSGSLRGTPLN